MDIDKYKVLITVIELGSFTRAAEELGYTQAAISHIVSGLEKKWKLTLLFRDRSGVRLTAEALKLLPLLKNICSADEELLREIEEIHGITSGVIRISSLNSIAVHLLPQIIKKFSLKYPDIDFDIKIGNYKEVEHLVETNQVDFGFMRLPVNDKWHTLAIVTDRILVILPQEHHLAKYDRIPIEKINGEVFLLLEEGLEFETKTIFEKFNIVPKAKFIAKDDYAIMSMVESGLGISILPELILKRTPFKIVLRELQVPMYRQLGIAFKNAKYTSPAVRRFLKEFVDYSGIDAENLRNLCK